MTHPCTWASQKGRELKLSCPERVTLWQLAERSATKGYCWPSVVQLMVDTGLARQTILTVVRTLASLGLIRIEKDGQKHVYHVLLPVYNKTANRSKSRPDSVQNKTGDRSNPSTQPVQNHASDRSKINTLTLNRTLKGTNAREGAREPETEVFNSEKQKDAAPAAAPAEAAPKAPSLGTPSGSSPSDYIPPGQTDPFGDWLADGTPPDHPGQPALLAAEEPDTVTEDDTPKTEPDRARMAAQLAQLAHDLGNTKRHFAIPRGPRFTANEHREIAANMAQKADKAAHLPPDVLRQMPHRRLAAA